MAFSSLQDYLDQQAAAAANAGPSPLGPPPPAPPDAPPGANQPSAVSAVDRIAAQSPELAPPPDVDPTIQEPPRKSARADTGDAELAAAQKSAARQQDLLTAASIVNDAVNDWAHLSHTDTLSKAADRAQLPVQQLLQRRQAAMQALEDNQKKQQLDPDSDYNQRRNKLAQMAWAAGNYNKDLTPEQIASITPETLGDLRMAADHANTMRHQGVEEDLHGQEIENASRDKYSPVVTQGGAFAFNQRTGEAQPIDGTQYTKGHKERPAGGGAGAGAGDATGGYGQDAIDRWATQFNLTGQLPDRLGNGKDAGAIKKLIAKRAAEMVKESGGDPDLAGARASYGADSKSLARLQPMVDTTDAFERTGRRNLDVFIGAAKELGSAGSPLLNKPMRALDNYTGDPKYAAFNAARVTAVTEVGKILGSAMSNGSVPEGQRHEVDTLLDPNSTLDQYLAAADVLKRDMANKNKEYHAQIDTIRSRMKGKKGGSEGAPPAAPAPHPDADAALQWARDNPNDPRAGAILKRLGAQ